MPPSPSIYTTTAIVSSLNSLYPLSYAERSWDNVGLLVDLPQSTPTCILLTIDLTKAVAKEATTLGSPLIIAYHPFLFRKFNTISPNQNPQHKSLVSLIQNNIQVYSPHTAIDASPKGVNVWLASLLSKTPVPPPPIDPSPVDPDYGMGRLLTLAQPTPLSKLIPLVKSGLGVSHLQVASDQSDPLISTVAICAGSGSSVFAKLSQRADLYLTGELSHHELLSFTENGSTVILSGHCNSERGFLTSLKQQIQQALPGIDVVISNADKSPFITV